MSGNATWELLAKETSRALKTLYQAELPTKDITVQETRDEFEGDLTIVVFPLARHSQKKPPDTAEEIGQWLQDQENVPVVRYNVVKGFLNLVLSDAHWMEELKKALGNDQYGSSTPEQGRSIMVEFSSPNTNKPLHLGHLRNNFLGWSVSEILKAKGHKVNKVQIINDRGIHICKSMVAWQKFGNGETPESSGMKGDHLVGKFYVEFDKHYKKEVEELQKAGKSREEAEKNAPLLLEAQEMLRQWEQGDDEVVALWQKMNNWVYQGFDQTYERMGVDFDKLYYESETYLKGKEVVLKGLKEGIFYEKEDGSVWCDLSAHKMDDKLLIRGDGTAVYMTQDIGTAILRYEDQPDLDQLVYTVGNEQEHHFKVLFIILDQLGYAWARNCYHLSYGMVDLPTGKMKSREGTVVDADDLMQEMVDTAEETTRELGKMEDLSEQEKHDLFETIGLAALKYFLLKVDPKKRMLFDPQDSIDLNGNTGPFIQYTHARIRSLLRKAEAKGFDTDHRSLPETRELEKAEKAVLLRITRFPQAVTEAGEEYSPAVIANYTYELVKEFNHFYQTTPILGSGKEPLRIALCRKTGDIIRKAMALLGVRVPEQM